jgi:Tol biopolymer transport system component
MWIPGYEAWSRDGSRVAYWTGLCLKWTDLFDCGVARYALYVADARTGTRTRAAYVSGSAGPAVFSPDGGRIVYHNGEARGFYVVDVP